MKFQNPKFVKSVTSASDIPTNSRAKEIAMVGRSNVGKSTLLNNLVQAKIAKTSGTPGKTQALNYFFINEQLTIVDLPGYGFAQVPLAEKKKWQGLIEAYLNKIPQLLLFLLDIRRIPSDEDLAMYDWIKSTNIPTIVVLTKTDKVGNSEKSLQTKRILDRIKDLPYVHYSAVKNEGRKELIRKIDEMME